MTELTWQQFQDQARAQGVSSREYIALICPACHTVQCAQDLIRAGAGEKPPETTSFETIVKYLGFSCVGRFTGAGPAKMDAPPGKGCDWTLGGLFHIHELEIILPDGKRQMSFTLADPATAQAHEREIRTDVQGATG